MGSGGNPLRGSAGTAGRSVPLERMARICIGTYARQSIRARAGTFTILVLCPSLDSNRSTLPVPVRGKDLVIHWPSQGNPSRSRARISACSVPACATQKSPLPTVLPASAKVSESMNNFRSQQGDEPDTWSRTPCAPAPYISPTLYPGREACGRCQEWRSPPGASLDLTSFEF